MPGGELATSLRSWRERLGPADVGLPTQALRRAAGLRREEVAQLAGMSVNYLTRLEQDRARNPSVQVLSALARALRLSDDEQEHLFRLAGHAPPSDGRMRRHLTPGVQRILDRLEDVPVMVIDAGWTVISLNRLAVALLGDLSGARGRERNIPWRHFTGAASRIVRDVAEKARMEAEVVADLNGALGRYPDDPELRSLVADLRSASERFESLWRSRPATVRTASRKTVRHPEVGEITLDCDVLHIHGTDLRLVLYSAPPGSPDADALALVGVLGLQCFPA